MTPIELSVGDITLRAAYKLQQACPWVVFTSGRRNWWEQAHAMAVNVARKRDWLKLVYTREPELQEWVDAHPDAVDVAELTDGLFMVLSDLSEDAKARFAHPAGRAFDLAAPSTVWQEPTITTIKQLPNLERFLQGEGGLPIWHCQFKETA